MKKICVGDKIKVLGTIRYGQDSQFFMGDFPDIIFTVAKVFKDLVSIVAPGYGELPGNYGNGAIFVYGNSFNQLKKVIIK